MTKLKVVKKLIIVGNTNLNVKFDKHADKTDEQLKQELKDLLEKNKDLKDLFH